MHTRRPSNVIIWLAVVAATSFAHPALAAEGSSTPRHRARVDDWSERITLKPAALQSTLAAILDESLSLEKRIDAIGLAGLGHVQKAVPALTKVLGRRDRIEAKVAAVWALREIGDPGAIPALLRVQADAVGLKPKLKYDKKISFAEAGGEMTFIELIEDSIGRLGELVLRQYLDLLKTPAAAYGSRAKKVTNLQRSALAVIVCVGDRDRRAVKAMMRILNEPKETYPADFRETAAFGLARILVARTKEFAVVRARDEVAEQIVALLVRHILTIEPSPTREYLANALNVSRPEAAVTLLTLHFADNSPDSVRLRVIEILALLRSRESVEALVWALENEKNPELRRRAAFGLGLAGGKSKMAHKALTKALGDKSPLVRRAAIGAIGRSGGKTTVPLVGPSVHDPDPLIRAAAAKALGRARDPSAVKHLLVAAADKNVVVRATAIAALGSVPSRESLTVIARAAKDDTRQVRFAALKVLANVHNSTAYIVLLRLVGDPDRKIKADASRALQIGRVHHTKKFKAALILVINSSKHPGSADACDLAEFPNDPEIIKALRKAAVSRRPGVRASAIRMLNQLGER